MSFSRRGLVCLLGLAALLPLLVRSSPETARADAPSKKKLLPVMSQGTGTLKGRVTLEGDPPDLKALDKQIKAQMELVKQHAECCLKGTADETGQQVWRLGKDKGVGNVFVWLAPPDGHYFEIDWKKKTWPKEIVIDQPHCAFIPHAVVHFPGAYEDGDPDKELKSSGQVLTVKNSAPLTTTSTGAAANSIRATTTSFRRERNRWRSRTWFRPRSRSGWRVTFTNG